MSKKDLTEAEKIAKKEKKERKEKKKQDKAVVEQQEKSSDNGNEDTPAEKSNDKKEKKDKKDKKDKKRKADKDLDDSSIKKSKKEDSNDTEVSDEQSEKFFKDNNMSISSKGFKPILSFDQLKVNESLLKPLKNFEKPTPIQSITWPCLLKGKDTIGIAETGSGKTLSFALPGLERHVLNDDDSSEVTILVIAPTRELAVQTYENVHNLNIVNSICLYGGVSKDDQKKTIKKLKPRVVVGTPGRLLDLVNDGGLNLGNVKYLVLDEADRMLDQGFEKDIRAIIGNTPKERQTAMFSATWPQSVRALASTFMTDPVRVTVGSEELTANKRVAQVIEVLDDQRQKDWKLNNHLKQIRKEKGDARVLIFALYKKEASRIENTLRRNGHGVGAIHGDLSQVQRMKALEDFKFGKVPLLVATDVAARGLDIPNVEVVINVTFPLTIEDYVHRIGRTGRGGKSGKSITFFTDNEKHLAGELQKLLREGGYEIPEGLKKFPAVIKKKEHSAYGAFYKDIGGDEEAKKPKKITFD